jgi:hypothetical protein
MESADFFFSKLYRNSAESTKVCTAGYDYICSIAHLRSANAAAVESDFLPYSNNVAHVSVQ